MFNILRVGIYLIPFYEIIGRIFPYAIVIGSDTRVTKDELSFCFAVLIFYFALLNGIKTKINKWLLAFIVYIFISSHMWWQMQFSLNDVDYTSFWKWKPLTLILAYFLMFISLTSYKWTQSKRNVILEDFYISGLIMACYSFFQYSGLDQFFIVNTWGDAPHVTNNNIVGNLGQPTILAPMLCIGFLSGLRLKKLLSIGILAMIIIIDSKMATISLICSVIYWIFNSRKFLALLILSFVGIYALFNMNINITKEMSGRHTLWNRTINDFFTTQLVDGKGKVERFPFTGSGLGSFAPVFHIKHGGKFHQAHNEYLEILYCTGIIGITLFLINMFYFLNIGFINKDFFAVLFVFMCCVDFGTFLWHLGYYQFITIIILSVINGGNYEENNDCFMRFYS